ncbi:MAG: bacterial extracellular solute-binding family protein [Massilia sp.]|nr:bacterial extracellular solute-binding family protein [Massilia sp.]
MRARTVTLLAALTVSANALAADLKVLTAGAFKPVLMAIAPEYERHSGNRLLIDNDTGGALARRIAGGEKFDLVVLPSAALDQLASEGKLVAGSAAPLAKVGIGVAVKRDAPRPDIASVAAFRRALLDARKVAYIDPAAGGSSGVYLAQLFDKLGIAAEVKAKAVLVPGGLVAQRVVSGEADLGVHQISEILAVPDAVLVGPIPLEVQNYTVYAGGVSAGAEDQAAAQALLAMLRGDAARKAMQTRGMEAAGR